MMLFHTSCKNPPIERKQPSDPATSRLRLQPQAEEDIAVAVRTYRCEQCDEVIHIDMDWEEGATVEPTARLD
jgi:hypothetical protein